MLTAHLREGCVALTDVSRCFSRAPQSLHVLDLYVCGSGGRWFPTTLISGSPQCQLSFVFGPRVEQHLLLVLSHIRENYGAETLSL